MSQTKSGRQATDLDRFKLVLGILGKSIDILDFHDYENKTTYADSKLHFQLYLVYAPDFYS